MINIEFIDRDFELNDTVLYPWLSDLAKNENTTLGPLSIVIGSDDWLLEKNKSFLKHNFYTDIITFDYSEDDVISGDLLISLDRVFDNADGLIVSRETELMRVIVHGVLHLVGFNDKTPNESELMRKKEDYYLSLL